jgi:hypothetical protein
MICLLDHNNDYASILITYTIMITHSIISTPRVQSDRSPTKTAMSPGYSESHKPRLRLPGKTFIGLRNCPLQQTRYRHCRTASTSTTHRPRGTFSRTSTALPIVPSGRSFSAGLMICSRRRSERQFKAIASELAPPSSTCCVGCPLRC